MGRDGLSVGVRMIRKFSIRTIRLCYRSVCKHPFFVGILLLLLFLYRSSPFLFSILVSASPVLVCTAVLLGTLLSFGEHSIVTAIEEEEELRPETAELRTGSLVTGSVTEREESYGKDSECTGLISEVVERSSDEEPLLYDVGRIEKSETDDDLVISSMPSYHVSRDVEFGNKSIHEVRGEFESQEIDEVVFIGNQKASAEAEAVVSRDDIVEDRCFAAVNGQAENAEDFKSVEGSIDLQLRTHLESSMALEEELDEDRRDSLSPPQEVHVESLEKEETVERSPETEVRDQLGSLSASWLEFEALHDTLSSISKIQVDSCDDYISAEGSVDAQIGSPLELSLGSWNHMDSDRDENDISGSDSDGAESSSPDASMADIIPLLDELHPLLDDENLQDSSLSRQGSAKSVDGSIHSDDESDQRDEEDVVVVKSDGEDDNEQETQEGKEDQAKSAVLWTEDDQKNLMDLGTSELERNQRLESLIARRRARRLMTDKNLVELEGMDLPLPISPISTSRYNPFDNHPDSYAYLDLPPIPGSAPSVMLRRPNPFDLPYDSSEEKPDLTGDGFQEEFMELTQREPLNQREALFRRNETFSMGSSMFDFGRHTGGDTSRPSRFRPYFVSERTDSDVMSYSSFHRQFSDLSESRTSIASLQRQPSELSESKASSVTDSMLADVDEKAFVERDSSQEMELTHEIDNASDHVEHGSQPSKSVDSLSDEENGENEIKPIMPVIELVEGGNTSATAVHTTEDGQATEIRHSDKNYHLEEEYSLSDGDVSTSETEFAGESRDVNLSSPCKIYASTNSSYEKDEVIDAELADSHVHHFENADIPTDYLQDGAELSNSHVHHLGNADIPVNYALGVSVSEIPAEHSQEDPEFSLGTEIEESQQKEPVYDSSPLAMKKALSSSSISSDLQRQTSAIDLYHVQRNLFAAEDSKDHDGDGEEDSTGRRFENDIDLAVNNVTEVTEHIVTESHLPETDLKPIVSPGSTVAEHDVLLSTDSLYQGLPMNQLSSEINYSYTLELHTLRDEAEVHHDGPLGRSVGDVPPVDVYKPSEDPNSLDRIVDDVSPVDLYKPSEDPNLALEEKEADLLTDHVSSISSKLSSPDRVEYKDEIGMTSGGSQFLPVSVSNLKNQYSDDGSTIQVLTSGVSQSLPHDSGIDDPEKQVPSISHLELEEYGQVNQVDETANFLKVQEPDLDMLSRTLQNDESMSHLEELQKISVSELDIETKVENMSETIFAHTREEDNVSSVVEELILYDEHTHMKDLDEELLSELDAVGDFSMNNTAPYLKSCYLDSAVNSDIPERFLTELHSSSVVPFGDDVLLSDTTDIQNLGSASVRNESSLAWMKKSVPDADIGDGEAASLVLADQSAEHKDTSFKTASKEDQESVAAESVHAELITEEMEPAYVENELSAEATGTISQDTEVLSLVGSVWNVRDPVPERSDSDLASLESDSDLASLEEQYPDSNRMEVKSEISADTEALEQPAREFDGLETDNNASSAIDTPQTTAENETGSGESQPFHTEIDISDIQESPLVETSIAPSVQSQDQIERFYSVDSKFFQTYIDEFEKQLPPVFESATLLSLESGHQMERVGSAGSESVQVDGDVIETQEFPIPEKTEALTAVLEDQRKRVTFIDCESLTTEADTKEVHESPAVETSITDPPEYEDQREIVGTRKSETLPSDSNIEESGGSCTESSIEPDIESKDQIKKVASFESGKGKMDGDVQGIQIPPVAELSNSSTVEAGGQREAYPPKETLEVQNLEDHQLSSEQQPRECVLETDDFEGIHVDSSNAEDQIKRVGPVTSEQLKLDGDVEEIQEHPVVIAGTASSVKPEDQRELYPQVGKLEIEDREDHRSAPQQQLEECMSEIDDSGGAHGDSATTVSQSVNNEVGVHASNMDAGKNPSKVEERSHESHLEISSSSSSSSSSSDSDAEYCFVQRNVDG